MFIYVHKHKEFNEQHLVNRCALQNCKKIYLYGLSY